MLWHLLQVSDVLDLELGSALNERVPLLAWEPARTISPFRALLPSTESSRRNADPPLQVQTFPLLRGYARPPLSTLFPSSEAIVRRLLSAPGSASNSPLIVTTPYFAGVAERWPGPVVYWLTDLMAEYGGASRPRVEALDARLCDVATLVCPNSARLADYLSLRAGCDPARLHILPNATRASNLLRRPPTGGPGPLPADIEDLPRPIAGVIGNLASNMDWELLHQLTQVAPAFSWVFVGPTSMPISNPRQSAARDRVLAHPRARFLGSRPYGALAAYARAFDVAILPYRRREPTYSGSSTRFYEHLAACRPMLATRGFEELLHKEPLLTLFDTAAEGAAALHALERIGFEDGLTEQRWRASQAGTWQARARSLCHALSHRQAPVALPA